jgi:hypothetical protein
MRHTQRSQILNRNLIERGEDYSVALMIEEDMISEG